MSDTYVKRAGPRTPADFYPVEAAGLRWLADSGRGAARVVEVLEADASHITLEPLSPGRPTSGAAEAFGRALVVTHAAGASSFGAPPDGWDGDGYIGSQRATMSPTATWGAYFADQRVLPYAREAERVGNLSASGLATVERVAKRLHAGDFDDDRPPARIHGDLWSGNVFWTADGVVLIDPAAHGGHGLTDLAMLHLFGTPELETITSAYAEAADLPEGWRELIGLHQLHPLLVHAVTHGSSYGAEAARTAARYA